MNKALSSCHQVRPTWQTTPIPHRICCAGCWHIWILDALIAYVFQWDIHRTCGGAYKGQMWIISSNNSWVTDKVGGPQSTSWPSTYHGFIFHTEDLGNRGLFLLFFFFFSGSHGTEVCQHWRQFKAKRPNSSNQRLKSSSHHSPIKLAHPEMFHLIQKKPAAYRIYKYIDREECERISSPCLSRQRANATLAWYLQCFP